MNVLIFDTETTGLPITKGYDSYYDYTNISKYNSSRLVQISWKLFNDKNCISNFDYIIKPDNFKIYNSNIHGITTEYANENGINFSVVTNSFLNDLEKCDTIVAHNFNFDKHILLSEFSRYDYTGLIKIFNEKQNFCTMNNTTKLLKLKNKGGYPKSPKLSELYTYLFNKEPENLHNSKYDTLHTSKCFFELLNRKLITL